MFLVSALFMGMGVMGWTFWGGKSRSVNNQEMTLETIGYVETEPSKKITEFSYSLYDSTTSKTTSHKIDLKKSYILHFWAPWCKHCVGEYNAYYNFKQNTQAQKFQQISIVSSGTSIESVKEFFSKKGIKPHEFAVDDGTISKEFEVQSIPATVFIKNGKEIGRIEGPVDWSNPKVKDLLLKLAEEYPTDSKAP